MNLKNNLFIAFIISFFSLMCFSMMALLVNRNTIENFDSSIISYIQGFESPWLTLIMMFFTIIGDTVSVILISIVSLFLLYKVFKHRSELILFISVMLGTNILFILLKMFFRRARPNLHRLIEASHYSFPSGHATMAFALYSVLTYLLWRHTSTQVGRTFLIIISSIFILAIGISRIYLGVHYPSDIIAGYFISAFWLTFAIGFYERYKVRREKLRGGSLS